MGFDRKAAEKAVAEAVKKDASAGGDATPESEREREIFRAALLALSAGA
jgi:hypothetical protein